MLSVLSYALLTIALTVINKADLWITKMKSGFAEYCHQWQACHIIKDFKVYVYLLRFWQHSFYVFYLIKNNFILYILLHCYCGSYRNDRWMKGQIGRRIREQARGRWMAEGQLEDGWTGRRVSMKGTDCQWADTPVGRWTNRLAGVRQMDKRIDRLTGGSRVYVKLVSCLSLWACKRMSGYKLTK